MPTFNNVRDLHNYIKAIATDNLKNTVGVTIKNKLKKYVDQLLYQNQYPEEYHRSYDLLNSITIKDIVSVGNNKFLIEVYFDSKKIHPREIQGGTWNQHMTSDKPYGQNDNMASYIAEFMNYGHKGLYWQEGLHFLEATEEELMATRKHVLELQKILNQQGINCIFK